MQRFFESVIEPIFEKENIRTIVEIGADKGFNTAKLIQYANRFGGKVYSIDPLPGFDSEEWERENPDTFTMCRDLSLNVIKTIKDAQCFLIDGDHNWYTVYNELCQIYETYGEDNFPLVMFHDILWPYDRRDLYYSPETIPAIYRHDYEKKAMKPSTKSLVSDGINGNLFNAKKYGGEKNGVLTAIEDFVNDHPTLNLDIYTIDVLHGLGMIASKEKYPKAVNHFYSLSALKGAMQLCENERLDKAVKINVLTKKIQQLLDAEKKPAAGPQVGKVYPNFGEGYSEETALFTGEYNPNSDSYYAAFTFEKPPEFIRFDPVDRYNCILENISLYDGNEVIEPYSANGIALDGGYVFTNRDPQIIYKNIHRSKRFEIRADIFPFKSVAAIKLISDVLDKNRCLEGEKCQLESENNALSEEKRRLNDQVMDKNREIERLNSSLKKSEKDLSLLKSSSDEQIKLTNDKITEISKKNTALSEDVKKKNAALTKANNSLKIGNRLLKRFLNLNKAVGWRYALKSLFSRGISATRANIKALKLIRKQGSFDMVYYCESYKDVLERGIDPLIHFIWFGGYENRNPYKGFDVAWYLKNYSDVRKSKINPYAHYVLWGNEEMRGTGGINAPVSKNNSQVKAKPESIQNTDEIVNIQDKMIEKYSEFYNYSSLLPIIYPQKNSDDQLIELYMKNTEQSLLKLYSDLSEDNLVTVIMPTYNRAGIIEMAIQSVVNQSYKNWRLIIVDDSSTDNTEQVVRKYVENDSRIEYIKNTHSKGVCGARNTGLEKVKEGYVAYLDTDNEWEKDYLLIMVNTLKLKTDYKAIYCAQGVYTKKKDNTRFDFIRFGMYNHSQLKNNNFIDLNCYMHHISLYTQYGGFDEDLSRLVDWELIHRYAGYGYPYALPCCLSLYYHFSNIERITQGGAGDYMRKLEAFDDKIKGENLQLPTAKNLDIDNYEMYSDKIVKYECGKRNVSIVIPSYEALDCLITCVEAVEKFTAEMNYEIIIVDNNSSEAVRKYLRMLNENDDKVKVILNDHNMGFTYAVNQGIKIAMPNSDIILLNNDAIVTDGWIEELYRVKDTVNAGIIAPRQVLLPNTKTIDVHTPNCNKLRESDVSVSVNHHNVLDLDKYYKFGYVKLSFVPFFLVMITRECIDQIGLLDDEKGRHYLSDYFYCQKANENGIEVVYTPYSKAYHLLQQSTQILKNKNMDEWNSLIADYKKYKQGGADDKQKISEQRFKAAYKLKPKSREKVAEYNRRKKMSESDYPKELEKMYRFYHEEDLNWNGTKFTEKMQRAKLYDKDPRKTELADKYLVRNYVERKIGSEYLIPLLGVYNSAEDINFSQLPSQFVLKTNRGSNDTIVVKDRNSLTSEDKKNICEKLNYKLTEDYSLISFELHYRDIPPKIVAEQYISDPSGDEIRDYKFLCFNGIPYFCRIDFDRFAKHTRNVYDMDWNLMSWTDGGLPNYDQPVVKPTNFDEMIKIVKILSEGFPHVRVDLYNVSGRIYFGEMTFTTASGFEKYPPDVNEMLGNLWNLKC